MRKTASTAALGFTVKSGWSCAVLVAGSRAAPRVIGAARVELSDPAIPESRQPYHQGFGTARRAGAKLQQLLASVRTFGRRAVLAHVRQCRAAGYELSGVGLVVGSLVDPETIANDHIRIHALEGRLFREVIADAAARSHLPCAVWRERDLYVWAAGALEVPAPELRARLTALGRDMPGAWRAEHKGAALAAWLVLAGHGSPYPSTARPPTAAVRAAAARR